MHFIDEVQRYQFRPELYLVVFQRTSKSERFGSCTRFLFLTLTKSSPPRGPNNDFSQLQIDAVRQPCNGDAPIMHAYTGRTHNHA